MFPIAAFPNTQVAGVVRLQSGSNPVVQGLNFTVTATVNFTNSVPATGTITITDTVTCSGAASASTLVLGTIALAPAGTPAPGSGSLVVSSSSLPCIGQNSIVASYPGDSNYTSDVSQPLVETVLAQFTPTAADLSASANPSAAGQAVVFTAVLKYTANNAFPTGTMTFTDTNTGALLGKAPVLTVGGKPLPTTSASITLSSLAAGSYAVQAVYSGDSVYSPSSSLVVIQVVGQGAPPTPKITSVVTTQGMDASQNSTIAQNTWVEIHGSNLAPSTQDWSTVDLSKGLPTSLGGVSATVNNKPAVISYISPTQVNILTPIDSALGPVPLQLNTPNGTTTMVTAMELAASPSFFVVDAAGHVAGRHVDFSPAGPASLSTPGFAYTPAKPGEVVLLYAVGLGQTAPPITDQLHGSGSLAAVPVVSIGGLPATVQAAAISGPGLYQLNVVVPPGAPDGDLAVSATYDSVSTESGVVLTVQH